MNRAVIEFAPLRVSQGIGGLDVLIAVTAIEQGDLLYTFNRRHFQAILGLNFTAPYTR